MTEQNKNKIDLRVTKEQNQRLFDYLNDPSKGKPRENLARLFTDYEFLLEQNKRYQTEIEATKNQLTGIRLSSRQAEKNTNQLLGIVNTWLFYQAPMTPASISEKRHPLLAFFETEHKTMLDNVAQSKVYPKKKEVEVPDELTSLIGSVPPPVDENPFK